MQLGKYRITYLMKRVFEKKKKQNTEQHLSIHTIYFYRKTTINCSKKSAVIQRL